MGVQLIKKDEDLKHEVDGSVFNYRRLPADKKAMLVKKHSKRGILLQEAYAEAVAAWGITGWDDTVTGEDEDGIQVPIPFDTALVGALPEGVRGEMVEKIVDGKIDETGGTADPT